MIKIARLGLIETYHSHGGWMRPCVTMAPQSGTGSCVATPRNGRLASSNMADDMSRLLLTTIGETMFGTMWRVWLVQASSPSRGAAC